MSRGLTPKEIDRMILREKVLKVLKIIVKIILKLFIILFVKKHIFALL